MRLGIVGLPNVGKSHIIQCNYKSRCGSSELPILYYRTQCGRSNSS